MYAYEVGKPYHPGKTRWAEQVAYQCRGGGHELLMFWAGTEPEEIEAVRAGESEFALFVPSRETLYFLYRFGAEGVPGALPWSDQPFSWWLVPPGERLLPNPEPGDQERNLLHVTLVDADTGLIQVLRTVSMSPEFTAALNAAIRDQSRTAWKGPAEYDKVLRRFYSQYPDSESMLAAAKVRCKGGD